MKEDEVIDILDALVSLPRREVLSALLKAEEPLPASDIASSLGISLSEALDHLQVLNRVGLVSAKKGTTRTVWLLARPLELEVSVSPKGIRFGARGPSLWERIKRKFR